MAESGPCLPYEKAIRSVSDMGDVDHGYPAEKFQSLAGQPVNKSANTKRLSGERKRKKKEDGAKLYEIPHYH